MVGWGGGRTIITERDGFGVRGIRAHPENSIVLRLLLEIATGSSLFSCVVCVFVRARQEFASGCARMLRSPF